jgi:phage/plasmid-associated DNA primase
MIDGCLSWQRDGLLPPEAVTAATAEYLTSEDALGAWIDERCKVASDVSSLSSDLFASWRSWAEATGEFAGSGKKFSQSLESRGFAKRKSNRGAMFYGLRPNGLE